MAETVRDVMTSNPRTVAETDTIRDVARVMQKDGIGNVLVVDDSNIRGLVTDRDIVIRAVAEGCDLDSTRVADICSDELVTVTPDTTLDDAADLMRSRAVRRLPVVEGGRAVGVVSIGDLAIERDEDSALAEISAAPTNN